MQYSHIILDPYIHFVAAPDDNISHNPL